MRNRRRDDGRWVVASFLFSRSLIRAVFIIREQILHGRTGRFGRIFVQLVPQSSTALAVSVCTHTAQKPVASPRLPLCLCREGRGKVISVLWLGVPALSCSYLRSSYIGVLVLSRSYLRFIYMHCLVRTYATAILGVLAFSRSHS